MVEVNLLLLDPFCWAYPLGDLGSGDEKEAWVSACFREKEYVFRDPEFVGVMSFLPPSNTFSPCSSSPLRFQFFLLSGICHFTYQSSAIFLPGSCHTLLLCPPLPSALNPLSLPLTLHFLPCSSWILLSSLLCFETVSMHPRSLEFRMPLNSCWSSCLSLPSARITSMDHHTWFSTVFFFFPIFLQIF